MAVNWGNVVTDPAEKARIMALAQGQIDRNNAGTGGTLRYNPGHTAETALDEAAYSFFPKASAGTGAQPLAGGAPGGGAPAFAGTAPTPTPYGSFTAPDVNALDKDPTYQYDLAQQQKAIQRGAAARGTLLTGGLQTKLQENASGVAGQHYGDIYNRALTDYTTNRDTNQQNFGQSLGSFNAGLGKFQADTSAGLGYGRLGLDQSDQTFRQSQVLRGNALEDTDRTAARVATDQQPSIDAYAQQIEDQKRRAMMPTPIPPPQVNTRRPGSPYARLG